MRAATPVVELINETGYFGDVEKSDIAGTDVWGLADHAVKGFHLVACVVVVRSGGMAFLDFLSVKASYQGVGVAEQLLREIIPKLRAQGVHRINASISGLNGPAMHLVRKFGATIGFPYMNVVCRLEDSHGYKETRTDPDDYASRGDGKRAGSSAVAFEPGQVCRTAVRQPQ